VGPVKVFLVQFDGEFLIGFCFCFRFFRFVSKQICLFRLFQNGSETPKQTETNRKKKIFGSAKQTENELKQIVFRFVSDRTEKKFLLFRGHPSYEVFHWEQGF
jgi:hypothetical protein